MTTWCTQLRLVIWLTITTQNTFAHTVKDGFFINDSLIVTADKEKENIFENHKIKLSKVLSYNDSTNVSVIKLKKLNICIMHQ